VGEAAIEVIIEERQNRPFHSLFDFCERVDLRKVNKRVIESLIKCGAFDEMGGHRAQLILGLEDALEHGQRMQREKNNPQMGLFDMGSSQGAINRPKLPDVAEWGDKERLAYEKEALGFYISGHPLNRYEKILDKFTSTDTLLLKESDNQAGVRLGGMVKTIKTIRTKKGDPMAFITLEDLHGSVEVVIFSSVYHACAALLGEDAPLLIQGQVQKDENSVKILADTVMALDEAESRLTAEVVLTLDLNRTTPAILTDLLEVLKRHRGESKTYLKLKDPHKTETLIEISENFPLNVGKAFVRDVTRAVGYNPVETKCSAISVPIHQNGNNNRQWRGAPNG
jgi:DNA polymerase-3 subunit alpha